MKKRRIITLLAICLTLQACALSPREDSSIPSQTETAEPTFQTEATQASQPAQQTETTEATQQTEATDATQQTEPAVTPPTEPADPNALTDMEIAMLQILYEHSRLFPGVFYNIALGQTYSDPRQIDLFQFFKNGDYTQWSKTEAEKNFVYASIPDAQYMDLWRADPKNMDLILSMCFGLTLADMAGNGLNKFVYFEETRCYYNATTSPPSSANDLVITGGVHQKDGNLEVYYTANGGSYVMILKPAESGYHILSNQEVPK